MRWHQAQPRILGLRLASCRDGSRSHGIRSKERKQDCVRFSPTPRPPCTADHGGRLLLFEQCCSGCPAGAEFWVCTGGHGGHRRALRKRKCGGEAGHVKGRGADCWFQMKGCISHLGGYDHEVIRASACRSLVSSLSFCGCYVWTRRG